MSKKQDRYLEDLKRTQSESYERYLSMVRSIEGAMSSNDCTGELHEIRRELGYLFTERPRVFEEPIDKKIVSLIRVMRLDAAEMQTTDLSHVDSFTRTEMVAFMIGKYRYLNLLLVYSFMLKDITGIDPQKTRLVLLTSAYFQLPRIFLFAGLETVAAEFINDFIELEKQRNWMNTIFLSTAEHYLSISGDADELCDRYFAEAYVWNAYKNE